MKNLKKYVKQHPIKMDCKQTSVNLETRHYIFILENGLNLSAMVRDMLSEAIDRASKLKN